MEYYVYRITNKKYGLHYYGVRSTDIDPIKDLGILYFSSSSDKAFVSDQRENPQDYKYKIINVFDTMEEALALEIKLHTKFNVKIHEKFYNRANQTTTGFDRTGVKASKETKQRMSVAATGVKVSEETKLKQSISRTGRKLSIEHKEKISKALVGRTVSAETKAKISKANSGKKRSEEQRKQFSEAHVGITHSEETKKKMSKSKIGHKVSEKTKSKIAFSNTGKVRSEESKQKQAKTLKSRPKVTCPHCGVIGAKSIMSRHHFDRCKIKEESILTL
jgi:hypothetical protein